MLDSNLITAVNAQPRKVSCKLDAGNSNIITDVKRLTYVSDWSGSIAVGQVVSSYISVTIPTPIFSIAGVNVALSMGIGDPATWTKIGDFRIDEESVRTKQGYTGFTAYDKLYYSVNTYQSALTFPATLQQVLNEVCREIGVTSPTLSQTENITLQENTLDGYNLRDVLGFIAGYCGKNAYLSPSGAVEFRWFSSTSYTADGTRANIPYIGENNCTIRRWICQSQEGTLISGSGEGLYFTCPFMTQARLDSLAANQQLVAYRKADVDIPYGNYLLQSGDIITVTTVQNQTLTVPIMSNSWTFDGGLSSFVQSYGATDYTGTANNAERSVSAQRVLSVLDSKRAAYRVTEEIEIATAHITGANGGYIKINFGGNGNTAELLVMDQPSYEQSLNVWVFNQNGLGHMQRASTADPFSPVNVALTSYGTVVAERIAGTMISGVGIENLASGTGTRPKITMEQGSIEFKRVAAEPDGTVSLIGAIRFEPRAAADDIDSISIRAQRGKAVTIGYEYNGNKSDDFVYYSDLSDPAVPSDAAKFNFWGDLRIFSNLQWISLTDLEQRVSDLEQRVLTLENQ